MSSATNALSMAETCLASNPTSLFTAPKTLHPFLSKPSLKLSNLQISSFPSWVSLKNQSFLRIVPLVAQTSGWAQGEGTESQQEDGGGGDDEEETQWENEVVTGGGDGEGYYPDPPEGAKLYVGNLPFDVDSEKLANLFNEAGVVEIAEVIYNRDTDQSRGFGFVTMSTVEEAEKAVELFSQYDLNGRSLTVNKAAPRGSKPERRVTEASSSNRIYVGNLAWQVDDGRLVQVFSEHGKVVDARVVRDRDSGRSRGFGFVTMASETEVNDAISALDGQSLDGRAIRVNVAEQRPRRTNSFSF